MKTKISLSLLFILILNVELFSKSILEDISNIFADSKVSNDFLQKAPNIGIEDIISAKISELLQSGKYFKYYKELEQGRYFIYYDQGEVILKILKHNLRDSKIFNKNQNNIACPSIPLDNLLGTIKFDIIINQNSFSLKIKEGNEYFDEKGFLESLTLNNENISALHHVFKERILIDKEICNFSSYGNGYPNLGKILNKRLISERTIDIHGNQGILFRDVTAGIVIPIPTGAGSPKLLVVDKVADCITMMDRDIVNESGTLAYSYPEYPGYYYSLHFPTDIVQGARRIITYGNYIDSIVSLFIADNADNRIVKLDYVMHYIDSDNRGGYLFEKSFIRDASFRIFKENCVQPYGLAIHKGINKNDSLDDVLWYSEGFPGYKRLVCVNAVTGQLICQVRNLRADVINPSRISIYQSPDGQRNLLGYIDEESNTLGILKLEDDGTFVNSNVNVRYLENFGDIKLKSIKLTSYNNGLNGTTIWTVGDGGNGGCSGGIHCGDVSVFNVNYINNFPVNVEYLATYWQGLGSPSSFVNLQNLYTQDGYLEIATMEKWTNDFGIRKYKPGVDIVSSEVSPYCYPQEYCTYKVKLTNPARVRFKGQYKPANGQWSDYPIYVNNIGPNPVMMLPAGTNQLTIRRVSSDQSLTDQEDLKIIAEYIPSDETVFDNNSHKINLEKTTPFTNCTSGGGCPYVFVNNGSEYIQDNNILHRSEFDGNVGKDIEDKYLLRVSPLFNQTDSTCSIKIKELNNDVSHFDKFQLVAIDHPIGTNLGITESNDYVLYFPSITASPTYAEHNAVNVTDELNYDSNYTKTVQGVEDDNVSASYEESARKSIMSNMKRNFQNEVRGLNQKLNSYKNSKENKNKKFANIKDYNFADSIVVMTDPGLSDNPIAIGPPIKRPIGGIEIFDSKLNNSSNIYTFAKRQNSSPVLVTVGKDLNIDSVASKWYSDFKITYLAITPVYYGGYIENSLTLIVAQDSVNGNVLSLLSAIDSNYAVMDSTTNIILKFKNNFGSQPSGYVRDFILITNGRYDKVLERDNSNTASNENQNLSIPTEYKLHQNYPNPFNPTTTIKFDLPKSGLVSIKVYDILGKEIYSYSEIKQAGYFQTDFNGSNLASGIYFYRIEAGNFITTKKMMILK